YRVLRTKRVAASKDLSSIQGLDDKSYFNIVKIKAVETFPTACKRYRVKPGTFHLVMIFHNLNK
ncbi:hypothetical protein, partial [Neobacillus niacini]|uniref:hypothetical protein n=1 Tax=Neobacillus niacini TaxID=86668 RepID=UPI001C3F178A